MDKYGKNILFKYGLTEEQSEVFGSHYEFKYTIKNNKEEIEYAKFKIILKNTMNGLEIERLYYLTISRTGIGGYLP